MLLLGGAGSAHASKEYELRRETYENKGVLYIHPSDVVIGSIDEGTNVVVFAFVPFDRPEATVFFNEFLPRIEREGVPVVIRPRITGVAGVSVYRAAQCISDMRGRREFLLRMTNRRTQWENQKNAYNYIHPVTTDLGVPAAHIANCLADETVFKVIYEMEKYALEQRVLRNPPMPSLGSGLIEFQSQ